LLTAGQLDRIEIVLVKPRNPLNIGAAARAMANFGFTRLSVVAPYEPHWRDAQSAVGAESLLQNARRTESLADAVKDCTLVIGTGTLVHRKAEQPVVALPDLRPRVASELSRDGRIALVFGSEKRGLTRDDLACCHLLAVIPTHPKQPSMNLGQAVAVCLYEVAARAGAPVLLGPENPDQHPATSGELDRLAGVIDDVMLACRYSPAAMREANQHDLRLLLRRLAFNETDSRRALGVFRRILHKLKH
jgi:tRNA/rRNA methyltransferase